MFPGSFFAGQAMTFCFDLAKPRRVYFTSIILATSLVSPVRKRQR
jgi:hypothetical protein